MLAISRAVAFSSAPAFVSLLAQLMITSEAPSNSISTVQLVICLWYTLVTNAFKIGICDETLVCTDCSCSRRGRLLSSTISCVIELNRSSESFAIRCRTAGLRLKIHEGLVSAWRHREAVVANSGHLGAGCTFRLFENLRRIICRVTAAIL